MPNKYDKWATVGVKNHIAEFRLFGKIVCKGGCGNEITGDSMLVACRAENRFEYDHITPDNGENSTRDNHAALCGSRLNELDAHVDGCNQTKGKTRGRDFYSPEMLARIEMIHAYEVTEADWQEFKLTYHAHKMGKKFMGRYKLPK